MRPRFRRTALAALMFALMVRVDAVSAQARLPWTLLRIEMRSEQRGWAVAGSPAGYVLLRTQDGGRRWRNVSSPGFTQNAPYDRNEDVYDYSIGSTFLGTQTGWVAVVGSIRGHSAMLINKTTDAGRHWARVHFPVQDVGDSVDIQFIDRRHGFILALGGPAAGMMEKQVYRTGDGGAHWQRMSRPDREGKEFYGFYPTGMAFRTPSEGWITAAYRSEPDAPFMHTRDAGRTWHVQALPIPTLYQGGYSNTWGVAFFGKDKREGIVYADLVNHTSPHGDLAAQAVYMTRNGGANWHLRTHLPIKQSYSEHNFVFVDTRHGWLLSEDDTKLYATRNGGRSWQRMTTHFGSRRVLPPNTVQNAQLDFVTPQDGWALIVTHVSVGPEAFDLLRTRDGGRHWSLLQRSALGPLPVRSTRRLF